MKEEEILKKVQVGGLKLTKQREAICKVFFTQEGHKAAEDILQEARKIDQKVSLATVYRTLKLLQENGLADSHNFQEGQAVFEPRHEDSEHHDHLICTKCSLIIEFVNEEIERLQTKVAQSNGFVISDHKMELYGLCSNCLSL